MGLLFSIFGVKKSVAGLMTRFLYVSMKESPFNKRAQMSEKCFEEHCNCTILAELSKMQTRHLDAKSRLKTLAWKKKGYISSSGSHCPGSRHWLCNGPLMAATK